MLGADETMRAGSKGGIARTQNPEPPARSMAGANQQDL